MSPTFAGLDFDWRGGAGDLREEGADRLPVHNVQDRLDDEAVPDHHRHVMVQRPQRCANLQDQPGLPPLSGAWGILS